MALDDDVGEVREQLVDLTERLDELIVEVLREAVEAGATDRPQLERRLTRARRALERAASLLGSDDSGGSVEEF